MNRAEVVALKAIARLASEDVSALILELVAHGPSIVVEKQEAATGSALTPAQRQARRRARLRDSDVTNVTKSHGRHVTSRRDVTPPDPPGDPGSSPSFEIPTERGDARGVTPVTSRHDVTVTENVTRDGAFGMTAAAWAEGIRSYTRKGCTPPRGPSQVATLLDSIREHSKGAEPVEWVRQSAAAYARELGSKAPNVFGWADWLNRPEAGATPAPGEGPAVKAARAQRLASDAEARRLRAPPPPELFDAIRPQAKTG